MLSCCNGAGFKSERFVSLISHLPNSRRTPEPVLNRFLQDPALPSADTQHPKIQRGRSQRGHVAFSLIGGELLLSGFRRFTSLMWLRTRNATDVPFTKDFTAF